MTRMRTVVYTPTAMNLLRTTNSDIVRQFRGEQSVELDMQPLAERAKMVVDENRLLVHVTVENEDPFNA